MSLWSWVRQKLGGNQIPLSGADVEGALDEYTADICIREMAFWSAVNIIANAVSKCEFKTFINGKEDKKKEYYLWNVEPNKNQNSSGFIHKWIAMLYRNNECLIIEQNGNLLVADSFIRKPYALYEDVFTQVTVGDFTFARSFSQSEVLYWQLTEKDMKKVTDAIYNSYSKLITYSMKAYQKSRGTKGVFNYDTLPIAGSDERKFFDALINEKFKKFMESGDAIIPLGKGQSYTDTGSKTYSNESTRDIRALVDDISAFTAKTLNMPPALLSGDVQGTKDATDNFLTFCIDPLVDMLAEEINRKRSGYENFIKGTYVQIDTNAIKHIDLLSVSSAIDKLISSGAFCVNDIRKVCGEPIIDEPWAWEHFMTKNYETIENVLKALKGGEES